MTETKTKLRIRKAPKFLPFLITGGIAGLITGLILNAVAVDKSVGGASILGYLIGWSTAGGAALGVVAALVVEWLFSRSAKEVVATKLKK